MSHVVTSLTVDGIVLTNADFRTRVGNTGGGDVYSRSFYAGPAGFYYITDASGNRVGFVGPDSAPAAFLTLGHGSGPLGSGTDDFNLDLSSGQVYIPNLKHASNIVLNGGALGGSALAINNELRSLVSGTWNIVGWTLITDASSALGGARIEVRKQTYASYNGSTWTSMSGTSNSTGGMPRTGVSSMKATSTNLSLWSDVTVNEGDVLSVIVNNNAAGIAWYSLILHGTKVEQ